MSSPIVVGYDGSPASDEALDWAAGAAALRGLALDVVVAWSMPALNFGMGSATPAQETDLLGELRSEADQVWDKARARVRAEHPDVRVSGEVVVSSPAAVLVDRSRLADLVVVGSYGRTGWSKLLLGSVSRQVASHSKRPTVIVRPPADPGAREIVVGVDGSAAALKALDWAIDEASRRGFSLRVIHTWEVPPVGTLTGVPTFALPEVMDDIKGQEMRATAEVLAGHRERYPDVTVRQSVERGSPVTALVDASEHAAMVVVGSRGRGGFVGLLLGSVSHGVVNQAKCPVAVVR